MGSVLKSLDVGVNALDAQSVRLRTALLLGGLGGLLLLLDRLLLLLMGLALGLRGLPVGDVVLLRARAAGRDE